MSERRGSKVSIRDISEYAGVSIATVSRVINARGKYSKKTEKKVWEVIRKYNYFTNTAARSLRTNQNKTIGLLLPDLTNELFAQITVEITKQLFDRGYSNIIYNAPVGESYKNRYRSLTEAHNLAGIISLFSHAFAMQNPPKDIPTVFLGIAPKSDENDMYVFIRSDYRARSYESANELISQGCAKILFLMQNHFGSKDKYAMRSHRYLGFLDALREHNIEQSGCYHCLLQDSSVNTAYESVRDMLSLHDDIDGILCNSAQSGVGAICAARSVRKDVPGDIKVCSFDDTTLSRFYSPQITSVYIDSGEYASLAVKSIVDLIENKQPEKREYIVASKLIVRESTRGSGLTKEETL